MRQLRCCMRWWEIGPAFLCFSPCTFGNASKSANQLLNHHTNHPDDDFVAADVRTFNSESNSNPVEWSLLVGLQEHGSLRTPYVLNKIISSCAKSSSRYMGIQVHSLVFKMGLDSNVYIGSALVDMYGKCGMLSCAQQLFDEMDHRNVVSWNSLISAYMHTQYSEISIKLFSEMLRAGITPTPVTVSIVLTGCLRLEASELGSQFHAFSLKAGSCFNVVVGTGLINMYLKCSGVDDSRKLFNQMPNKNVVTWTSMVSGYTQNQEPGEAMVLLREMLHLGLKPNSVTYSSLLSSFCYLEDLDHCKQVHCRIIREGLEKNAYLVASLVTAYSECSSSLEEFYKISSSVTVWDQISCNAVMAGFSSLENVEETLACFSKMRWAGIDVDSFTFTSILKVLGIISALEAGKQTHALIFKTGYGSNVHVQNGLITMYAKCGKIGDAKKIFSSMKERDLISWNSVLSGCAHHGNGKEVVGMFEEMRTSGIKPDLTTFLAVLSACSHVGLLEKGLEYFNLMVNNDFVQQPKVEHYACIVDLYSRAGYLDKAEAFINSMPIDPGPSVFKSLLSACQVHGNTEVAARCARKLVELCPNDPATYVLLSNVLAIGSCWNEAEEVRKNMCERGVRKKPGYSWI